MEDFVYHNPAKILFGKSKIDEIGPETAALGKKVLLVSGIRSAKKSGLYSKLYSLLEAAGCTLVEFDGVQPNPTVEKAREGAELARQEAVDVICAVGGGSVIDTGKAIRAGALVNHDLWKFFTGKKTVHGVLPMIAVPTLAGSGSEMNHGMVLTNEEKSQKFGFGHRLLLPNTAIMDPQITFSVKPDQTAFGAVDALSHLLELYMTSHADDTDVQDRVMEGLARTILMNCNKALESPGDYNARANLMWSSALALSGLASSGLGRVGFPMHLLEHSLSALYNIPHGAGLAIIVPGWLRYSKTLVHKRMGNFFQHFFDSPVHTADDLDDAIRKLEEWFISIGAPTRLEDIGVHSGDLPAVAENTVPLAKVWRMRDCQLSRTVEILRLCLRAAG